VPHAQEAGKAARRSSAIALRAYNGLQGTIKRTGTVMNDSQEHRRAQDTWDQGDAYERYMGRWSRLVAREFIGWLGVAARARWLDVGAGTGVLSQSILQWSNPASVTAIDPSAAVLAYAREQITDQRVRFETGDARQLPVDEAAFDAVVAGLVLNFIPEKGEAIREMARAAKPGGVVAAYVWDYVDGMQMHRLFWEAAVSLWPEARVHDVSSRFTDCKPGPLAELLRGAGLHDVETRPIEIATPFQDFEDYWMPLLGGQGTAPGFVRTLDEDARSLLREALRLRLPAAADGSITLAARAWAVRGRRAGPDGLLD